MKLGIAFVTMSLLLSAAAVADNMSCPTCLANQARASGSIASALATDPLPALTATLAALRLDNVAALARPTKTLAFPQPTESSRYLQFEPNPPEVKLPNAFDPSSVDPTFHSDYWNWKVPSYTEWLPRIWGPLPNSSS